MNDLESRSRELFHASVDGVDLRMRSRLNRARQAALEAAAARRKLLIPPLGRWAPAVGASAALLLGAALWLALPGGHRGVNPTDMPLNLDDLEIVASSDEAPGDALDMLQDDIEFYAWAEKAANSEIATQG